MDDTRTRIIRAAMAAVRRYGLEGVRIQNVSEFAGITPGAIYRHFESKEQLLTECFTFVDKQAAEIFEHLKWDPLVMLTDPMEAVKELWLPYFRFWIAHPFFITGSGTARFFPNMVRAGTCPTSGPSPGWSGPL